MQRTSRWSTRVASLFDLVAVLVAMASTRPVASSTEADAAAEIEEKLAPLYRVICHDDPVTTMDFVVEVLRGVFRLPQAAAVQLMLSVHRTGAAVIGRYPRETAQRRVKRAVTLARANGFPLAFTIERDE